MFQMPTLHRTLFLAPLLLLATAIAGRAQENTLGSTAVLTDNIIELRVFLTPEPGVVLGEIATVGLSALTEFSVAMEDGTVTFRDDGTAPDREGGDGVFTAPFKFDATSAFEARRADLEATIEVLRGQGSTRLIRRGPRDIVSATDAVSDAERIMPATLAGAREQAAQALGLLATRDPLIAVHELNLDPAKTPFLRLPGPRFDALQDHRFKVEYLFDFPVFATFPPLSPPIAIDHNRSLMITAKEVVEDGGRSFDACSGLGSPGGAWSFGHLVREMAYGSGVTPEEFALSWLSTWGAPQPGTGWIVPKRDLHLQNVIETWRRLSGGALNIDYFPARLMAIVNRPDLAHSVGGAESAGEGRLVFGLVDQEPTTPPSCTPISFTIIFEYGIAADSCTGIKAWQQRWKDLDSAADYNQALESITRAFTDHGSNPSQIPNMSSLNQLRTNETMFGLGWQWREFRLGETGVLSLVTVKQTPDDTFNGSTTLQSYLGTKEGDILNDRLAVPEHFPGALDLFLGATSSTQLSGFFWFAQGLGGPANPDETRRKFSLATCNGCHTGETGTRFTHIGSEGKRETNEVAQLSKFLVGEDVTVPAGGGVHHYEDLTERKIAMSDLLTRSCFEQLAFQRLPFVH